MALPTFPGLCYLQFGSVLFWPAIIIGPFYLDFVHFGFDLLSGGVSFVRF